MTRPTVSLLALTVAATAVTAGYLLRQPKDGGDPSVGKSAASSVKLPFLQGRGTAFTPSADSATETRGASTVSHDSSNPVGPSATPQALIRQAQAEPARAVAPTRQELEWRAAKVEQEANHEMEKLVPLLQLTEPEQDRVFSALVRRSAYFDSVMGAASPASPTGGAVASVAAPTTGTSAPSPSSSASSGPDNGSTPSPLASTSPATTVTTAPTQTVAVTDPTADLVNPAPLDSVDGLTAEDLAANDPVYDALPEEKKKAYLQAKQEEQDFWTGVMSKVEAQLKYAE